MLILNRSTYIHLSSLTSTNGVTWIKQIRAQKLGFQVTHAYYRPNDDDDEIITRTLIKVS